MKKIIIILIILLFPVHTFAAFNYVRTITIDKTKIGGTVATPTNFPVEIDITQTELRTVGNGGQVQNTNGYDIWFGSTSDCVASRLSGEREIYTATTGRYTGWVKVASLSTTTNTTIYMCYGDASISVDPNSNSTYGATSVWDSNYKGVWHLPDGSSLTANDSTSGGLGNGTVTSASASTGKIDGASSYNGSSAQIDFGAPNLSSYGNFTASAWIKASSVIGTIFTQWSDVAANAAFILDHNGGSGKARCYVGTNAAQYGVNGTTNVTDGNWHHIVCTWNSAGFIERVYVDGVQENSVMTSGVTLKNASTGGSHLWLGRYTQNAFYSGTVDEARISNAERSADWIKTEYNNQSATSTFYTIGSETVIQRPAGATRMIFRGIKMIIRAGKVIFL